MIPQRSALRKIISINICFLAAACLAGMSRLIWSESAAWWQLGVYSIILGFASAVLALSGLKQTWALFVHDIEMVRFFRKARQSRSDRLADDETMQHKDMI